MGHVNSIGMHQFGNAVVLVVISGESTGAIHGEEADIELRRAGGNAMRLEFSRKCSSQTR
jgi:hypothetical protein